MPTYRGRVVSFDSGSHTAVIRLEASSPQTLTGVRTSRAIASGDMTAGRRVILDTGDHNDPADFVVTAVWTP
jgi:hypothetical protein